MIDSINDNDNIKDINIKDVLVIEPKTKTRKRPILNFDAIRNTFKEFFIDSQNITFNFKIDEPQKG
jgi:nitrous oxide reductase